MIGSHNSFSYLPPRNLWGKITKVWGKCQSLTLKEQYIKGVRFFDIRLKFINDEWHIVHNKIDYGTLYQAEFFYQLTTTTNNGDAYFRFILDERSKPKNVVNYVKRFIDFIQYIRNRFYYINIVECRTFWDWRNYDVCNNTNDVVIKEYHASVSAPWYKYLLGTKHFAKKYNNDLYVDYKKIKCEALLIDYIEYGNE